MKNSQIGKETAKLAEIVVLPVYGMKCQKCVARVTELLKSYPEVGQVEVLLDVKQARILPAEALPLEAMKERLHEAGFATVKPTGQEPPADSAPEGTARGDAAGGDLSDLRFPVAGMHCASCAQTVEKKIATLAGVESAVVNLAGNFAQVRYQTAAINADAIYAAVDNAGYKAVRDAAELSDQSGEELKKVWIAAAGAVPIMLLMYVPLLGAKTIWLNAVLASFVQFAAGSGFYVSAYKSLRNRSANMDVLVALGISAAYGYSLLALFGLLGPDATVFFETSAMLILFIRFGKWLEARAKGRASAALKKLLQLQADTAVVVVDGQERKIPASEVKVGDRLVIRPGEKVPVDGEVLEGSAAVDEAMISGEAVPVIKEAGDQVIGATINRSGRLLVVATRVGEDAMLAQIVRMVELAQGDKPPIQRLADRISAVFVPIVLLLSLLTFVTWYLLVGSSFLFAFQMAVAVVVVACPCALGLATPTAVMVGSSVGLELGILFKKASVLEQISRIRTLLLDKTGTLTSGQFRVEEITVFSEMTQDRLLQLAMALEHSSTHPLAISLVTEARERGIELLEAQGIIEQGGHGLSGLVAGKTVLCGNLALLAGAAVPLPAAVSQDSATAQASRIYVAVDGVLQGWISLADQVKEGSKAFIERLVKLGIEPVLVTGDRAAVAARVAGELGIHQVEAEVLPEQKLEVVRRYQLQGQQVGMVGDGINDAPAIAQADIGIAIGSGTDVAKETGDLVLVGGDLRDIERGILLGRKTLTKIKQNLFWAFFYNLLAIPLAAGLLYPWFGLYLKPEYAGLAMAFSSVSVVSNSLLLRNFKKRLQRS